MEEALRVIIEKVPQTAPDLITILSGLLTPVIAILATYIAWKQHHIDKYRLKNELYDRRAEVYTALDLFLIDFIREGHTTFERTHQFYNQISKSKFLFDKDIQNYLMKIYRKAIKCYELQIKMYPENGSQGLPVGEERSKVAQEQCDIIKWISKQSNDSIEVFREYFEFK